MDVRVSNPLLNLWRTYRRTGLGGAAVLTKFYVERVRVSVSGPGRCCPICNWNGPEFYPLVYTQHRTWRRRVACPRCGSFERHRRLWFAYDDYFRERQRPARVLHFAAEECFRPFFQRCASQYIRSDYGPGPGDVRLDLDNLGLRNECIDLIVATAVFPCVPDSRRAVNNLQRILTPGGTALLCDPVNLDERTQELAEPCFGERRHLGGRDLAEIFSPFDVRLVPIPDSLPAEERERFGFAADDFQLIRLDKKSGHSRAR